MQYNLVIPDKITQKKVIFAGISLEEGLIFFGSIYMFMNLFNNINIFKLKIFLMAVAVIYLLYLMLPSYSNPKRRNAEVLLKYLEYKMRKMKGNK